VVTRTDEKRILKDRRQGLRSCSMLAYYNNINNIILLYYIKDILLCRLPLYRCSSHIMIFVKHYNLGIPVGLPRKSLQSLYYNVSQLRPLLTAIYCHERMMIRRRRRPSTRIVYIQMVYGVVISMQFARCESCLALRNF